MKRNTWFIVGGIALIALLAGGAYMGGRLLSQKPQAAGPGSGVNIPQGGSGGITMRTRPRLKPAPELPQTPADASGVFVRHQDRSIFIGTGASQGAVAGVGPGGPGPGQSGSSYSGPVVEVVVNQDTVVYRDSTDHQAAAFSGVTEVQQTVELGSVDEIGESSMVQVWGKRTGDRLVAQTLVYSEPTIIIRPAGK